MNHMHNGTGQMQNKQAISDMLPGATGSVQAAPDSERSVSLPSAGDCLTADTTNMKHMHNGRGQMQNKQAISDMMPGTFGSAPSGSGFGAIRDMAPQQ